MATWTFSADVSTFDNSMRLFAHKSNYQPVIQTSTNIRQAVRILTLTPIFLHPSKLHRIEFQFLYQPEVVLPGNSVVIEERKVIGRVVDVLHDYVVGDGIRKGSMDRVG